jgi:DNA-directed RNA polymerase specialized sigma24 family protein
MGTTAVEFDYDDVLPTVRRAHPHASMADAEDAVQVAVEEHLRKGAPLIPAYIIQCARFRLLTAKEREARTLSLDAFEETNEDSAPFEAAIDEVDFDSHGELAEARRNPILRLCLEAAEQGAVPTVRARGSSTHSTLYPSEIVDEARRLHEREGQSFEAVARQLGVHRTTVQRWCHRKSRCMESPGWSRELVIKALQAFAREESRRPTIEDVKWDKRLPAMNVLYRFFPGMADALQAAGLPPCNRRRRWNRDSVLDALIEFRERTGRWPRHADIKDRSSGLPTYKSMECRFGTSSLVKLRELAEKRASQRSS